MARNAALVAAVLFLAAACRADTGPDACWHWIDNQDTGVAPVISVAFVEGPVYNPSDGSVLFSDILNNRILRVADPFFEEKSAIGTLPEVWREPSGRSNGLAFDLEGRLVACEGAFPPLVVSGNRRVTRTEHDGRLTVLADHYEGKMLNSPNDLDIDAKGRIYFTDPRYGPYDGMEMDVQGVYRIDVDDVNNERKITRIISDISSPNGIAVSPDQQHLYVLEHSSKHGMHKLWDYELTANGQVGERRLLHDFGPGRGGDGMCLDEKGNLYVAAGRHVKQRRDHPEARVSGGIHIFSPNGDPLGFVPIPEDMVTNCAFGGEDMSTLFVTAGDTLYRVPVKDIRQMAPKLAAVTDEALRGHSLLWRKLQAKKQEDALKQREAEAKRLMQAGAGPVEVASVVSELEHAARKEHARPHEEL